MDGDVRVVGGVVSDNGMMNPGEIFTPEVYFEGETYPICGLDFADDAEGAAVVCTELGFIAPVFIASIIKTDAVFERDAMPIGRCLPGESLGNCTGGGNGFGDLSFDAGKCTAGNPVGVQVACTLQQVKYAFRAWRFLVPFKSSQPK